VAARNRRSHRRAALRREGRPQVNHFAWCDLEKLPVPLGFPTEESRARALKLGPAFAETFDHLALDNP